MARHLRDDAFARLPRTAGAGATGHNGAAIIAFSLASIALLALSRLDHSLVRGQRNPSGGVAAKDE